MWDVKLYPFFTRNSNLVFKKHVHKTKFGEKCFWSWKNENSKNFGFQNILPFFSVSTSISAPGQWPILTGSLRQCFWVLNLLFYLLKSWRNYIIHFTRFFYKNDFFHRELFFLKNIEISCILTGKVLLDNTHTMFKSVCTTPTVHQNAIFWPKSWFCGPKKGFLPILTPKSALCPKFLLPHGISGYLLTKIAPKYPQMMMIGHVVGPHWYIYRVPGLSNMPIVTIFLDPTCYSWPQVSQMSQIVLNHDFM